MQRFLQHDALASGCFNLNHCSGAGSLNAWSKFLTNDINVLQLMCSRLESDWTCLAPKMRKSWGAKEVDPCQILSLWFFLSVSACGVYMCLLQLLQIYHTVSADVANQGSIAKGMWMLLSMCSPIQVHCVRCFLLFCHWWYQKSAPCHHSSWWMKLNETKDFSIVSLVMLVLSCLLWGSWWSMPTMTWSTC